MYDTHASPATAGDGLDHDRIAHLLGQRVGLVVLHCVFAARRGRHFGLAGHLAGLGLVAQQAHGVVRRPDELDLGVPALVCELRILGQETVARMDGIDVGHFGRRDDTVGPQIALRRRRWADAHGLVGELQIGLVSVRLRIHAHRLDTHLLAGSQHPQGDLSAIGDEDS